jgi:putative methionine-R-sulfoxide reductase with GAF domain
MTNPKSQEDRLKTLFKYFVDVVRINIFITTKTGKSIITPDINPYGWKLLADTSDIKSKFKPAGNYLEYVDVFGLHHFAIPISAGYVIVGPIAINKKLNREEYREIAIKSKRDADDLIDALDEIRVVSQTQLKSILDLIAEAKDFFMSEGEPMPETQAAEELNQTLKALLDAALRLANAQSGSIMLYQESRGLTVHVSKGINPQFVARKPIQLGEGISGYALAKNRTFILTDKVDDNRIAHLLKRKEIKQSIVMPFASQEKTIQGVLNINIQNADSLITGTDQLIKSLNQITATALQAF